MAIVSTFPEKRGLNTDDINDIANGEISNGFVQSQTCYSTEEQIIGKWINGKPVYQKTYDLTNTVELTKDNWTIINEVGNLVNIGVIIDCNTFTSGGTFMVVHASVDANKLKLGAPSSSNFRYIIKTITLKYTKTTD